MDNDKENNSMDEKISSGILDCRSFDELKQSFQTFKRKALSVFEANADITKFPKLFDNSCNEALCSCDSSDVSETCSFNSSRSSGVNDTPRLLVKCLEPYEVLKEKCERLGLGFVDAEEEDKEYEIELILEHKIENGEKFYLVKWKNWEMNANTWEPDWNLVGCSTLVNYYETLQKPLKTLDKHLIDYFVKDLVSRKPYDYLSLMKFVSIVMSTPENELKHMNLSVLQLRRKAREILDFPLRKNQRESIFELMRFAEKRKPVLINLKEWEQNINSFNPSTYIEVENNVDLDGPPVDFQFIHDYLAEGLEVLEPAVFCECDEDCFKSKNKCCPTNSDAYFAYNKFRRLQLLPGYPIYECNKLCKCGDDCTNRLVQHGSKIKVAIFKTSNGCGWGLKTLETIHKNQFVVEYLGEILTSEAAEIRGREYDNVGRSYLFDLDYGDQENCKYTVDAGKLGNSSHFINHSCDPNLHVFAVWINNHDPNMPRLAFFAKRKIRRGEELTFDYKMIKGTNSVSSTDEGRVLCKCNARNCRKYLC